MQIKIFDSNDLPILSGTLISKTTIFKPDETEVSLYLMKIQTAFPQTPSADIISSGKMPK